VWWHTPVIPGVRRLRQENHQFEASMGYIVKPCLKTTTKNTNKSSPQQFCNQVRLTTITSLYCCKKSPKQTLSQNYHIPNHSPQSNFLSALSLQVPFKSPLFSCKYLSSLFVLLLRCYMNPKFCLFESHFSVNPHACI
jgi:hypothetical protein